MTAPTISMMTKSHDVRYFKTSFDSARLWAQQ